MRDIADIGLQTCEEILNNVSRSDPTIAGVFYQSYYLSILQDIFFVLTDRDHKSGKFFFCVCVVELSWLTLLLNRVQGTDRGFGAVIQFGYKSSYHSTII